MRGSVSSRDEKSRFARSSLHDNIERILLTPGRASADTAERPPPLLMVGGAARSGTTLLQSILCASTDATPVIAEAAPVRLLLDARRHMLRHTSVHPGAYFASEESLDDYISHALDELVARVATLHAARYVVLKEPELTKSFLDIHALCPETRFVCIVRDPRDAVASMKAWGERAAADGRTHPFQTGSVEELATHFASYYRPFQLELPETFLRCFRFVRYEDLVRKPGALVKRLREFSGLDISLFSAGADWARCELDLDPASSPVRDALTSLYGKPVDASSIGAYKRALTREEAETVREACGFLFHFFSYR